MKTILKGFVLLFVAFFVGAGIFIIFRKNRFVEKDIVIETYRLPESKFLDWKGNDIHYIEKGSGPTILLVHGLGGSVYDWEDLFYMLAENYHTIAVDLPGFSLSDAPDMSVYQNPDYLEEYRSFMQFFMDEMKLDSFHLVGNSMGGWISWETAVEHPERLKSLSLLAPAGYEMSEVSKKATGWLKNPITNLLLAKGLPPSITKINLEMCYGDDDLIEAEELVRRNMVSNKVGNLEWMRELGLSNTLNDTTRIPLVTVPTLIVWGTADEIVPFEHAAKFHRDIQGSELITYENRGHTPQMEIPELLFYDLTSFIQKHE